MTKSPMLISSSYLPVPIQSQQIPLMSMALSRTNWDGSSSMDNQSNAVWDEAAFLTDDGTKTTSVSSAKKPPHHDISGQLPLDRSKRCSRIRKILGMDHIKGFNAKRRLTRRVENKTGMDHSGTSGCTSNNSESELYTTQLPAETSHGSGAAISSSSSRQLIDPAKIENLLSMIRSDVFIGTIDPEFHSCYLTSADACNNNDNIDADGDGDCEMTAEDTETTR